MSVCIEIPQCIELKKCGIATTAPLCFTAVNKCDYDLVAFLYFKDRQGRVLHSISIDLRASEEKDVELPIKIEDSVLIVSGEWSLKGTTLKLPLKEIVVNL